MPTASTWHPFGTQRDAATVEFPPPLRCRSRPAPVISTWPTGATKRVQVLNSDGGFVQKLRGEATLSAWAANFLSVNVEEGEARSRANLEPEIDYFVDEPHEESSPH